jgi:adenylate cyclase
LVVPESDVLGTIDRNTMHLSYALLGFVALIAALVAILATRTLAKPLVAVTQNARLLGDFRFDEMRPVSSQLTEISTLSSAIRQMSASLASFKKYIPTEVVRTLFAQGIEAELGGERRELTIFFMDLVNFTGISEEIGDDLIPFLGEYLSEMSDVVNYGGGTIDKFIGDAVMAFWGAPITNEQHALAACRAALACQARLRTLREAGATPNAEKLRARIGLNTGRVLVGNVGSRERLNYTVIGDPVNVASRLESLNKRYGSEILIGEDTYAAVKDQVAARRLDRVAVYGKAMGIEVYELLALADQAEPVLLDWVATYERGIDALRARAWHDAQMLFAQVIEMRGGTDPPSRLMLERAQALQTSPAPDNWDGLLVLAEK